jgi:hypothetical protein
VKLPKNPEFITDKSNIRKRLAVQTFQREADISRTLGYGHGSFMV